MAHVRRAALSAAPLALIAAGLAGDAAPAVRLHPGTAPSGLVIENPGSQPVLIERAIGVEKAVGGHWTALGTEMNAVAACAPPLAGPVRLAPGARLSVVPWRGGSCAGQCVRTCRANLDYPPGDFRFVVTVLPGRAAVTGPAFHLAQSLP